MSVKTALMKAFGFRSSDDDEDDMPGYVSAAPVQRHTAGETPTDNQPGISQQPDCESSAGQIQNSPGEFKSMPLTEFPPAVFDGLIEVFNQAQPDFIQKCLGTEAQRQYLYEKMDASFKEYIGQLKMEAAQFAENKCSHMMKSYTDEFQQLRDKLAATERRLEDQKQQCMSATRQKRAMSSRVSDLEQQLESARAEKEQYALETKSLLNKLKVAKVREGSSDSDLDNLQYKAAAEEANRRVSELNAQAAANQIELEKLTVRLEALNNKLAESEECAAGLRLELEQSRKECSAARTGEREAVQKACNAEAELAALKRGNEVEKQDAAVQGCMFGDESKNIVMTTGSKPASGNDDCSNVKTVPQPSKPRRRKKPKHTISAIDETLDATEWLLPTPPDGVQKSVIVSDAEFGYHEPQREDPPRNDAQLSLFD